MSRPASPRSRRWLALGVLLVLLLGAAAFLGLSRRRLASPVDYLPAAGAPAPAEPTTLTQLRAV